MLHRSSSLILAHASDLKPLMTSDFTLVSSVFAGCYVPLLEVGPSRRYLLNLCIGAWTHTPLRFSGAFTRFFPENIGLTLGQRGSACKYPIIIKQFPMMNQFPRLQSFTNVQAPILACPPDCSYRCSGFMCCTIYGFTIVEISEHLS